MTRYEYYDEYSKMLQNNINVFKDTIKLTETTYKDVTEGLINLGTIIYEADAIDPTTKIKKVNPKMSVEFINGGTINTAYSIKTSDNRVAILNFADAKRPGGWVIDGAPTQEENICRCTNMYPALNTSRCDKKYYKVNDIYHTEEHIIEEYTDTIIYLQDAVIFKDDTTYERKPSKYIDIITCPAPCGQIDNVEEVLVRRIKKVLIAAYLNGATDLVLGAWGCGAFGQDLKIVARAFAEALDMYPVFDRVVFAIKETYGKGQSSFNIFKKEFLINFGN